MAPGPDTVHRVVCREDVVTTVDAYPSALRIVNDVIRELDVVRLVMNPWRNHELESRPLAGGEST
ncbi:MAG: hypothetical protein ACKO9Z_13255, partial [Planctomycetota bacterium]